MDITSELLAAYAEGNVSDSERKAVRQYLVDNPDELETIMMMMDEDYDLDIEDEAEVEDIASASDEGTFSDICYSAAAFAPRIVPMKNIIESLGHDDIGSFNKRLGDLLDELDL
ncbi:MAG: hypothetical protein E7105_00270 [Prevotella sp.]|nr:hypothetical protein [Prevotella sp.]